jgi:nucleotide-binding universal stress UspA family protein
VDGANVIETVVVATDGSESVTRCIDVAIDLADRFDADVHALYVVDEDEIDSAPSSIRDDLETALREDGELALATVESRAERRLTTALREGRPASEISSYASVQAADVVAVGTRGRHGEHRFLVGSVAERLVRSCPVPVLTVRQLRSAA